MSRSRFNHVSCQRCWDERNPTRAPIEVIDPPEEKCCFCALPTKSGIYVRGNPSTTPCGGDHGQEPEA